MNTNKEAETYAKFSKIGCGKEVRKERLRKGERLWGNRRQMFKLKFKE